MLYQTGYGMGRERRNKGELLGRDADKAAKSRLVARNTVEWTDSEGVRRIRLHDTDILTFLPRGGFTVNTGGWNTSTTRARINEFLPAGFRVYTERGQPWLYIGDSNPWHGEGRRVPFRQRVTVGPRGAVKSDTGDRNMPVERDRKLIDAYMIEAKALAREGNLPEPYGGDPFIPPDPATGKYPAGVVRDWLREKYVFGSFIRAAYRFSGMTDQGIWYTIYDPQERGRGMSGPDLRLFSRKLRRYIRACLGYEA